MYCVRSCELKYNLSQIQFQNAFGAFLGGIGCGAGIAGSYGYPFSCNSAYGYGAEIVAPITYGGAYGYGAETAAPMSYGAYGYGAELVPSSYGAGYGFGGIAGYGNSIAGCASPYGGAGIGKCAITGKLPVGGITAVAGNCGCGGPYMY